MFLKYSFVFFAVLTLAVAQSVDSGESRQGLAVDKDDGKSSLVFVFDTTGSMYNDLRQLREGAEMILDTALQESDVIADFVFVPFHDPAVGPATVTKDKRVLLAALEGVTVRGGGDCPERSLGGILAALAASRPGALVYVFTDATAADHRLVGAVLDAVQRKQAQVVFVLTGHCNDLHRPHFKVYQQIAAASSGQLFNLNKTSVHKVLDFVRSSVRGRTVNLRTVVNPPGYNYSQGIPIDSNLKEVTVSVSGSKPSIRVVNPSGVELTGPPKLITTLDLSEIMVVKVLQPEAGNWTILTGSEDDHSVKVVGVSNLTFSHGFSAERPASMGETSYRPLQGAYNYMMISLSDSERPVRVSFAEILTLEGRVLFEVPLRETAPGSRVYLADPFVPPDDFFYISINGLDEYNQEFRRIGATAVQSKLPSVPYLTVSREVEARAHDSVTLNCKIESLVPLTAMWTKDAVKIQPLISSLQSTSIQYTIHDMSEADAGTYTCVTKNVAGLSRAATEVTMIVEPPQVTVSPVNPLVNIGENVTIFCTVVSEALLLKYQMVFNGTMNNYVRDINMEPKIEGLYEYNMTIHSVDERDSGIYSCVASNRGGEKSQSIFLTIQLQPTAQIIGPHTLTKLQYSAAQLVCHAENARDVLWVAPNGDVVKNVSIKESYNDAFTIRNVSEDGSWGCVAVRGDLNSSDFVKITVLMKPEVSIEGSHNITITNGTIVEIVCDVTAKPAPRIIWHKETEDFLNNAVTTLEKDTYKSVLILDSGKGDVQGTYFCFGENSEGIHQDSVTINVTRRMTLEEGFQDTYVQLYSQIALSCRIDAYPPPCIVWYHNATAVQTNDHIRLSATNNTLYILKVDFDNLGDYKCLADNGLEKMAVEGTVKVVRLEVPILLKEPTQWVARRGESTAITCSVTKGNPQPSLTWQYRSDNSDVFTALPDGVTPDGDGSQLTIDDVKLDQSGLYKCIAENVVGTDTHNVTLVVQYPPELKASSTVAGPLLVEAGRTVTLSCQASGTPPPVVVWNKDHQPVDYSRHVYLTDASELVIEKATEYDSGEFTCKATSILGATQRNFSLIVYVPPVIAPPGVGPEMQVVEGDLVELPCGASGAPAPSVVWMHNGDALRDHRKQADHFGLRFVANLTDFGEYTCVAQNMYGNASFTFFVYIWVAPYIEPLGSSSAVLLGSDYSLECNVVGFPLPSVAWEFQGQLLRENTTDLSFNDFGSLNITNATVEREGLYSCVAENVAGITKKSTYLHVNEPPRIVEDNFTGAYIASTEDTRLVLACRATGRPKPYIAWSKHGRYIDKDSRYDVDVDGTLTIKDISEDQSGEYVCIAKNAVGTAEKVFSVEIYSPPARMLADESQTSVTLLEGTAATVECPIRNSDNDIVKWYKDAKLISTNSLTIPDVTRKDASTYACVVTNAIGSAYSNVEVDVEWPPMFVEGVTALSVEVVRGDDWYFDCGVDAKPLAKTKWLFNSKPLFGEDKERLRLINIQVAQTGNYKCVVSNAHGTIHKQFTLDVLVPPFISEFDLLDVQLLEGTEAALECGARGDPAPAVTWTYNNTNWRQVDTSLTARDIGPHSVGLYRCDAVNRAGAAHIVYRVSVAAPAHVLEIVAYSKGVPALTVVDALEIVHNDNLRVSCKCSGEPPPIIQWIFNGKVVGQSTEGVGYADLVIAGAKASDAGSYTCIATNEGGSAQSNMKVIVLEPPKIFQDLFGNGNTSAEVTKLEVISGQSFYLHCHPYGNPVPEVYWFKDELPLRFFDDTMESTDYGEVIASSGARSEQSGNYTCVARNKVGNATVVYQVDVLLPPPTPKENTKIINTKVGRQLVLNCPVEGSPTPVVTWLKYPYNEIDFEDPRITLANENFALIINQTKVADSGRYSCVVTNKVGSTEAVFVVTVAAAPSVVGGDSTDEIVVAMRRSLVLLCQATGHPEPTFTWLKDTQPVSSSVLDVHGVSGGSVLVAWAARAPHAGRYICVAGNHAGTAHKRYNVRVQVPGKWSEWSQWSLCNATCGPGHQQRTRSCHYTDDDGLTYNKSTDKILVDESGCKGSGTDRRRCHMPPCERGGAWGAWGAWGACSASCGRGTQLRARQCRVKDGCIGDNVQIRKCAGLPTCSSESEQWASANEVFSSTDHGSETNPYIPAATFEMNPEGIFTNVDESLILPDGNYPGLVYDVEVTDNLDKSVRGPCPPGYRHSEHTRSCEDIDECLLSNNACHRTQACANTPGAYRCECPRGFMALGVGQRCLDMNECSLDTSGCEYACVNTAGGYVCACPRHLRLHSDRHHCVSPSMYGAASPHKDVHSEEYLSARMDLPSRHARDRG